MSVLDSYDAILASIAQHGSWRHCVHSMTTVNAVGAPAAGVGGPTQIKRFAESVTVPSMGTGIIGMYLIQARAGPMGSQGSDSSLIALEYELGSLNFATDAFTAGVTMPTKRYSGRPAVQSAAQMVCLHVSSGITATTPTITVTYTNQDGVGSRTATMVLPTNSTAVGLVYYLTNALEAGDVAVRSVENMTKSAGTVGTVKCYGYLVINASGRLSEHSLDPLLSAKPNWLLETGDKITFLAPGGRNTSLVNAFLVGVAET